MSFDVDIRDEVSEALESLPVKLHGYNLNEAIGAAVVLCFQMWMRKNPSNKMGWPSTGFWAQAARATSWALVAEGVVVSVNKIGVRQRFSGGEIRPVNGSKYLTIPAREEAYGKRAGEFNNLSLAFHRVGGQVQAFALVVNAASAVKVGKRKKDGTRTVTQGDKLGGVVMFWLVKSVTQTADPSVVPDQRTIGDAVVEVVRDAVGRALRRKGTR